MSTCNKSYRYKRAPLSQCVLARNVFLFFYFNKNSDIPMEQLSTKSSSIEQKSKESTFANFILVNSYFSKMHVSPRTWYCLPIYIFVLYICYPLDLFLILVLPNDVEFFIHSHVLLGI